MYLFNARYKFNLPEIKPPFGGSIIAASALSAVDLQRRKFKKFPHLAKRYLDPQLYMAGIDEAVDVKTVSKLAAYPWFHGHAVPKYDSGEHKSAKKWKKTFDVQLAAKWTRTVCTESNEILLAARSAVEFQVKLDCDVIILPSPLTTIADQSLQAETAWLEAGLTACEELNVTRPIFATIAISEDCLHSDPLKNALIHSYSNQIASRSELSGAYTVLEQSDQNSYFWTSRQPLLSLLILVDDLHRGAQKEIIVNYVGTFGLVATAVGADQWSSGYYLSQRRFCRKGAPGRAHPRYHSLSLAADIGLKADLDLLCNAGLTDKLMTHTAVDKILRSALNAGKKTNDVPEWRYSQSNCAAAQEHYLELTSKADSDLSSKTPEQRIEWVQAWLSGAAAHVQSLKQATTTGSTELLHQKIWLEVFQDWRNYAKQ